MYLTMLCEVNMAAAVVGWDVHNPPGNEVLDNPPPPGLQGALVWTQLHMDDDKLKLFCHRTAATFAAGGPA